MRRHWKNRQMNVSENSKTNTHTHTHESVTWNEEMNLKIGHVLALRSCGLLFTFCSDENQWENFATTFILNQWVTLIWDIENGVISLLTIPTRKAIPFSLSLEFVLSFEEQSHWKSKECRELNLHIGKVIYWNLISKCRVLILHKLSSQVNW